MAWEKILAFIKMQRNIFQLGIFGWINNCFDHHKMHYALLQLWIVCESVRVVGCARLCFITFCVEPSFSRIICFTLFPSRKTARTRIFHTYRTPCNSWCICSLIHHSLYVHCWLVYFLFTSVLFLVINHTRKKQHCRIQVTPFSSLIIFFVKCIHKKYISHDIIVIKIIVISCYSLNTI